MSDPNPSKSADPGEHGTTRTVPTLPPRLARRLMIASLVVAGVGVALPATVIIGWALPAQDRSQEKLEAIRLFDREADDLMAEHTKVDGEYIRSRWSNEVLKERRDQLYGLLKARWDVLRSMRNDWLLNEHEAYEQAAKAGQTALGAGGVLTLLGLAGATVLRFPRRRIPPAIWGLITGLIVGAAMAATADVAFRGAWCALRESYWWAIPLTALGPLVGWRWGAAIRRLGAMQTASEPAAAGPSEGGPSGRP